MAIGELRVTIKPRWNIYLTYTLIKIGVPNRWLFSVSEPCFVEGI